MSKAHQKAVEKYNALNYERLTVRIRKEDAALIRAAVGERSMNGFILEAINEKIERETATGEIERIPFVED